MKYFVVVVQGNNFLSTRTPDAHRLYNQAFHRLYKKHCRVQSTLYTHVVVLKQSYFSSEIQSLINEKCILYVISDVNH